MDNGPEPPSQTSPPEAESQSPEGRCLSGPLEEEEEEADLEDRARHAARLRADRELRDALAADGFTGPAYAVFEEGNASFGYELMMALLRTGYIFTRCRQEGLHLRRMPIAADEREDLAQETVAGALQSFKTKGLEQGGWRPERGACLKTYFTRALLLQFANIWRKKLSHLPDVPDLSLHLLSYDMPSRAPGPDDSAAQCDEIRRGLNEIDNPKKRAVLVLTEEGYQQEEIAEIIGITQRAVEGLLRRHRSQLAARNQEGESHL